MRNLVLVLLILTLSCSGPGPTSPSPSNPTIQQPITPNISSIVSFSNRRLVQVEEKDLPSPLLDSYCLFVIDITNISNECISPGGSGFFFERFTGNSSNPIMESQLLGVEPSGLWRPGITKQSAGIIKWSVPSTEPGFAPDPDPSCSTISGINQFRLNETLSEVSTFPCIDN